MRGRPPRSSEVRGRGGPRLRPHQPRGGATEALGSATGHSAVTGSSRAGCGAAASDGSVPPAMATLGLSKVFILDKYFTELQKFWETEKKLQGEPPPPPHRAFVVAFCVVSEARKLRVCMCVCVRPRSLHCFLFGNEATRAVICESRAPPSDSTPYQIPECIPKASYSETLKHHSVSRTRWTSKMYCLIYQQTMSCVPWLVVALSSSRAGKLKHARDSR